MPAATGPEPAAAAANRQAGEPKFSQGKRSISALSHRRCRRPHYISARRQELLPVVRLKKIFSGFFKTFTPHGFRIGLWAVFCLQFACLKISSLAAFNLHDALHLRSASHRLLPPFIGVAALVNSLNRSEHRNWAIRSSRVCRKCPPRPHKSLLFTRCHCAQLHQASLNTRLQWPESAAPPGC